MACFFFDTDSYGFGKKTHTSHFSFFFCDKIVIMICSILAVIIKDLALRGNNKKLVNKKSVIWFKLTSQKKVTDI